MTTAVVKKCDLCRAIVPGKLLELRAVIVLHDNGRSREAYARVEACGESCLATAHAALVREVREAQETPPSPASECHAIRPLRSA